jgi:hypothetical protein
MTVCKGNLIVHSDGTPALCSEELAGRSCGDLSFERHRIFRSCGFTFLHGCPKCESQTTSQPAPAQAVAGA